MVTRCTRPARHERVDGTGYPDGLAGDEIPLGARIVAVCDAYDAMTSDRPYRRAMSADAAVAELLRYAGTQSTPMSSPPSRRSSRLRPASARRFPMQPASTAGP